MTERREKINHKLSILQIKLCAREDMECVKNSKNKKVKKECLKPCKGLYFDVKKHPVEIVQVAENNILNINYISNFSSFQDDQTWFTNDEIFNPLKCIY